MASILFEFSFQTDSKSAHWELNFPLLSALCTLETVNTEYDKKINLKVETERLFTDGYKNRTIRIIRLKNPGKWQKIIFIYLTICTFRTWSFSDNGLVCFPSCSTVCPAGFQPSFSVFVPKISPLGSASRENFRHLTENLGRKPAGQTVEHDGKETTPLSEKDQVLSANC